jgi:hypothetical protein
MKCLPARVVSAWLARRRLHAKAGEDPSHQKHAAAPLFEIGLASGSVLFNVLGDPANQPLLMCDGRPVTRAQLALSHAPSGRIALDISSAMAIGLSLDHVGEHPHSLVPCATHEEIFIVQHWLLSAERVCRDSKLRADSGAEVLGQKMLALRTQFRSDPATLAAYVPARFVCDFLPSQRDARSCRLVQCAVLSILLSLRGPGESQPSSAIALEVVGELQGRTDAKAEVRMEQARLKELSEYISALQRTVQLITHIGLSEGAYVLPICSFEHGVELTLVFAASHGHDLPPETDALSEAAIRAVFSALHIMRTLSPQRQLKEKEQRFPLRMGVAAGTCVSAIAGHVERAFVHLLGDAVSMARSVGRLGAVGEVLVDAALNECLEVHFALSSGDQQQRMKKVGQLTPLLVKHVVQLRERSPWFLWRDAFDAQCHRRRARNLHDHMHPRTRWQRAAFELFFAERDATRVEAQSIEQQRAVEKEKKRLLKRGQSIAKLEKMAGMGNVDAMEALVDLYVDDDEQQHLCLTWIERAALAGSARSQFQLAMHIHAGSAGAGRDDKRAFIFLEKAAAHQHADAIYELARCHSLGRGTKKDLTAACSLYRKAAKLGIADANAQLWDTYWKVEAELEKSYVKDARRQQREKLKAERRIAERKLQDAGK